MKKTILLLLTIILIVGSIVPIQNIEAKELKKLSRKQVEKIEKKISSKVHIKYEKALKIAEKDNTKEWKNLINDKGKLYIGKYGWSYPIKDVFNGFLYINGIKDMSFEKNEITEVKNLKEFLTEIDGYIYYKGQIITSENIDDNKNIVSASLLSLKSSNEEILSTQEIILSLDTAELFPDYSNFYKNNQSSYTIRLVPKDEKCYLKDCYFYIITDDYRNLKYGDYDKESISTKNQNDYLFKKTFSLENAPSYDNFEEEMMDKFEGKGKKDIKITKSVNYNDIQIDVYIPIYDKWRLYERVYNETYNYYKNYYKEKGYDVTSIHYGGGDCSGYSDFKISYYYNKSTRECIEIEYTFTLYYP